MFWISSAWYLWMIVASTSYDYNYGGYHMPYNRWVPETTINGNMAGTFYRTMDDCMIAASNKLRTLQNALKIPDPIIAVRCDHHNPNVNSPNRPVSIQAIEYIKKETME